MKRCGRVFVRLAVGLLDSGKDTRKPRPPKLELRSLLPASSTSLKRRERNKPVTTALTEYPGLEAKAQQLFEISYAELGPRLQKCVRSKVVQEAAEAMLEALTAVWAGVNDKLRESCDDASGSTLRTSAIALVPVLPETLSKIGQAIKKASGQ